jgi:hypothetical protein
MYYLLVAHLVLDISSNRYLIIGHPVYFDLRYLLISWKPRTVTRIFKITEVFGDLCKFKSMSKFKLEEEFGYASDVVVPLHKLSPYFLSLAGKAPNKYHPTSGGFCRRSPFYRVKVDNSTWTTGRIDS